MGPGFKNLHVVLSDSDYNTLVAAKDRSVHLNWRDFLLDLARRKR